MIEDEGIDIVDREVLLRIFIAEAEDELATMEQSLIALEAAPHEAQFINTIFRAAHTLKGNAGAVGLDAVVDLAHLAEDLLDALRSERFPVTSGIVTLLLQCVDELKSLIPAVVADAGAVADSRLCKALQVAIGTGKYDETAPDITAADRAANAHSETLRVRVRKLDQMLNLAGEIAIVRVRMRELIERLGARAPRELAETQELLDRLCTDLQDQVMNVRMVPVEPIFRQQVRVARDLAQAGGKSVEVVFEGEDVELDTAVVEQIRNPLTHIVRNAIDHGIETAEQRLAHGKPAAGTITLRAVHQAGMVVLEVSDDGAGINRNRIVERARALGLIEAGAEPSEEEIDNLIFLPGMTTATVVTEVSGRGVGMDVVHRNITALRGTVSIHSRLGRGTTVTMRLPLTMAIIDALSVGVGSETFVIPVDGVVECLGVTDAELGGQSSGVIDLRGSAVPFIRLADRLGVPAGESPRRNLLLVRSGGRRVGVIVDRVLSRTQAVIKPLSKSLARLEGIAGATILGNGNIVLILDLPRLLRQQLKEAA